MGLKVPATLKVDEPEKHLVTEHALRRKTSGRLLQAVTGRRYWLRHGHGEKYSDLKVIHVHIIVTKGSNSCSSRLSLHFFHPEFIDLQDCRDITP